MSADSTFFVCLKPWSGIHKYFKLKETELFKPSHELCIRNGVRGAGQAVNFCAKSLSLAQERKFQEEEVLPGGIGSASVQCPRWQHRAALQVLDPSHEIEGFRTAALAGNFGQLSLSFLFPAVFFFCKHFRPMLRPKQTLKCRNLEVSWF